jgi:hypothetical protein
MSLPMYRQPQPAAGEVDVLHPVEIAARDVVHHAHVQVADDLEHELARGRRGVDAGTDARHRFGVAPLLVAEDLAEDHLAGPLAYRAFARRCRHSITARGAYFRTKCFKVGNMGLPESSCRNVTGRTA